MAKTGSRISWNWAAAIFGGWLYQLWFFYRKMFFYGLLIFSALTGLGILTGAMLAAANVDKKIIDVIVVIFSIVTNLAAILIFGLYGNYIYGKFVYDSLKKYSITADEEELRIVALSKGGTSVGYIFLGILAEAGIVFVLLIPIIITLIFLEYI